MKRFTQLASMICLVAMSSALYAAVSRTDRTSLPAILTVEYNGVAIPITGLAGPLNSSIEVIEYQDGDDLVLRKRPGRVAYDPIQIKVARFRQGHPLFEPWIRAAQGIREPETMEMIWRDSMGKEQQRIRLIGCWVSGVTVDATGEATVTVQTEQIQYLN